MDTESECSRCFTIHKTTFTYSLTVFYKSPTPAATLFSYLYDSASVKKLNNFYDSIIFRSIDSTNYQISTFFHYLKFKGKADYIKTAFKNNDSISIVLQNFVHNWSKIPKIIKLDISFKIIRKPEANLIIYRQTITANKKIGWFESNLLHWYSERASKHFFAVMKTVK